MQTQVSLASKLRSMFTKTFGREQYNTVSHEVLLMLVLLWTKMGQWQLIRKIHIKQKWIDFEYFFQIIESSPEGTITRMKNSSIPQTVEQLRSQSILFLKLFVIMGITWIGECIHVLLHGDHSDLEDCSFYSEVKLTTKILKSLL